MDQNARMWLEILTSGKVKIEADQARAILWLAIGNAVLELRKTIGAEQAKKPGLVKTKAKPGRKMQAGSLTAQVLHVVKSSPRTSYPQLRAALGGTPSKKLYKCVDNLLRAGKIVRDTSGTEVTFASR